MNRDIHMTVTAATLGLFLALSGSLSAQAAGTVYKEKNLYDFCRQPECLDGASPISTLVIDASGTMYGTTRSGGAKEGVAFELVPHKRGFRYQLLYAFDVNDTLQVPVGDLILDKDGNLYGTAAAGGDNGYNCGAVFELKPNGGNWSLSTIYEFFDAPDGCEPAFGLTYAGKSSGQPWDGSSPLFGTTQFGGAYNNGAAYELLYNGSYWTESIIHSFQTSSQPSGLIEDPSGNLWGTTQSGGKYGFGLMYRLAPGTWKETVLHNFCNTQNCPDGGGPLPFGRLFMDSSGNVFGTTLYGGSGSNCPYNTGCGVVFERTSGGAYEVLYNFCSVANCADGLQPYAGVILNVSGNLVGTTFLGGSGYGVAFELVNSGGSWSETIVHSFCSLSGCTDGENPNADLIIDGSGRILGMTQGDGSTAWGNVFELVPR